MLSGGVVDREFTAPAGVLTLLRAGGWAQPDLLDLLYESRHDGLDCLIDTWTGPSADSERLDFVRTTLQGWLRACPTGPLELDRKGIEATAALACCWSSAVTHALSKGPCTLASVAEEANSLVGEEVVREHLDALLSTGQAEIRPSDGGVEGYALTEWGAAGIAPLVAAVRHELRFPQEEILPPEVLDIEATFQLCGPRLRLPADLRGTCRLSVAVPGDEPVLAGATVEVVGGKVISSSILLDREPETWATGDPQDWCEAAVDPAGAAMLETGGDTKLAMALVRAVNEWLFGPARSRGDPPG